MPGLYVEYALSFGVARREGLWKIQYLHPEDANLKVQAWVPMYPDHELIGEEVEDIMVAEPGVRLVEVMGWLHDRITRYPYYWPKEGTYVDKFGYDFEVDLVNDNDTRKIEITQVAYDILREELRIPPPTPETEQEVDVQYETVPGGGVLVKLSVTLATAQPVSEVSIAPFTKYPMELVSLMYEEDIETFHPKKEILLPQTAESPTKFSQTTQSIRIQFPVVTAKRLTFILRQQNHEKNSYLVNDFQMNQSALWNKVSQRETEVVADTKDSLETATQVDINTISGWDIYMDALAKHQKELLNWQKEFDLYKQKQAEREQKLQEKVAAEIQYSKALDEYRSEYNAAVEKYKTRVAQYKAEAANYEAANQKYQRDLKVYNKYLRDYADWKSKWG
jgi:hypothetical protein